MINKTIRSLIARVSMCAALFVAARLRADVVEINNGTRLVGKIARRSTAA
jgi:hypothetical protein